MIRQSWQEQFKRQRDRVLWKKRLLLQFMVRPYLLRGRVKHLWGPCRIDYAQDELLIITVVRNGALYIRSFLDHYRLMGVKHFVFLDNGSTDQTLEMLCAEEQVTVLQSNAPYSKYENTMKRYLADTFSPDRWNLCADIDELFDYPFSDRLSLRDFLRYLNENKYSAVVAQMLDLFSDRPLNKFQSNTDDLLKEKYVFYDISCIDTEDYRWSESSNPDIKFHWGGIRKLLFKTKTGLTKAPLVRMDGKVKPFIRWHHAKGARMADISCLLMHYPFVSSFYAKVGDAARSGRYGMLVTDEYKEYAKVLENNETLSFKLESAQRFTGMDQLIKDGFLVVSDNYRRWVDEHAQAH